MTSEKSVVRKRLDPEIFKKIDSSNTETLRGLIEYAPSKKDADRLIAARAGTDSYADKLKVLCELFHDVRILGGCDESGASDDEKIKNEYNAFLTVIIDGKCI